MGSFRDRISRVTRIFVAAVLVCGFFNFWKPTTANAAPTGLPGGFSATTLINHSMIAPTSVRIAPDGRIFVFDLLGSIKIFNGSGFNAQNFGAVSVNATGDRGLLGAVFDTDFSNNPYVYIHYVGTDDKVRIGRFNASGSVGTGFTELYVAPVASGFQHAGGGITMGLDGKIIFGIGDSGTPTNSQSLTTIHGKLHRINRDGSVPTNPFSGQSGVADTVYAYGVRNPFRLTTDKLTGAIYLGDVGYNTWEEINLVEPGKNYGWATQEGPCTSTCAFQNPVYWYAHQFGTNNTNDASIVAGPIYRGNVYPASYQGKMFVSDYVQGFIRTINPSVASTAFSTFSTGSGTVIDMDVGPDGKMYFVTINSPTLYRLDYTSGVVNAPPVAVATSNVTTGPAPLSVQFSSAGSSDPEGQPLSYMWDFGDGTTSTQANPTKTYATNGQRVVTLTVSDGVSSTPANTLTIKVGNLPVVTIHSPVGSARYNGGQTISYSASAVDANGSPIADSALRATVRLHHSDHDHPFLGPFVGGSGQIVAPTDGELSPDVWLRLTVEATDINGVTGSMYRDIQPNKSQITVNTSPAGLNVVLDGSNHVIPPTVQGVVGMQRQIAAPSPQIYQGQQYVFDHWSDSGAQDHTFTFPSTPTTYTAHYVPATSTTFNNLIANTSFEQGNGATPTDWFFARWGTNDAAFTVSSDARTGVKSARMQATSLTSGEGRLYHAPLNVSPSTTHTVQYFYKSNVQMKAVADVTLVDNSHKYIWLGISQPSSGWNEQNWTFTTPVNAKSMVVNLYLTSTGFTQVDDFSVLAPGSGGPVTTPPVVNFSASSNTVIVGDTTTLNWSTTGTSPTCVASNGWSGTLPASGTQSISPAVTTAYTVTCTNTAATDTKSVTIVVNSAPTVSTNLVPNPSFEDHDQNDQPIGWRTSKWGTNNGVLTHQHGAAYQGDHSLESVVTSRVSGEAGWYFSPVDVQPSTLYTYRQFVKNSGPSKVLADITLANGSHKYTWLGSLPNVSTWTEFEKSFTTPADAVKVSIGTYTTGVGSFAIDQVSLAAQSTNVPTPAPVVSLLANPSALNQGASSTLSWSSSDPLASCVRSGAWTGSTAASGSAIVLPSVTSTYTLTCTNSSGSDSKSVTVNVSTIQPPALSNLVSNGTLFETPVGSSTPIGWIMGGWGTNSMSMSVSSDGRTDTASLQTVVSNYSSGDAKWIFEPVTVTGAATYEYSDWFVSDVRSEILVEFTLSSSQKEYQWLGMVEPAASWTKTTYVITAPAAATKMTVMRLIKGNGTIRLDDISVTAQ